MAARHEGNRHDHDDDTIPHETKAEQEGALRR